MQDFLLEQIKTISNLCQIAVMLRELNKDELLPTILELMLLECQDLVDVYCVAKDD